MVGLNASPIGSMKPYLVIHAQEVPLPAGLHMDDGVFALLSDDPRCIQCFWGTCLGQRLIGNNLV